MDVVVVISLTHKLFPPQFLPLFLYSGDIRGVVVSLLSPSQAIPV